jgi:hypothetical protein
MKRLRAASQAACSQYGSLWQIIEAKLPLGNEYIAARPAWRHGGQDKSLQSERREILETVDSNIHGPIQQGTLDFLGKDALPTDGGERNVAHLIACGLDLDEFDRT